MHLKDYTCKDASYDESVNIDMGVTCTHKNSLSITDNRTGKSYQFPISHNAIQALHFKQITAPDADAGLLVFDPGLRNTAVVESKVAYLYE